MARCCWAKASGRISGPGPERSFRLSPGPPFASPARAASQPACYGTATEGSSLRLLWPASQLPSSYVHTCTQKIAAESGRCGHTWGTGSEQNHRRPVSARTPALLALPLPPKQEGQGREPLSPLLSSPLLSSHLRSLFRLLVQDSLPFKGCLLKSHELIVGLRHNSDTILKTSHCFCI